MTEVTTTDVERNPLLDLLSPFPPEHVGKLPRVTCPACSNKRGPDCKEHKKERCNTCNAYVSTKHMHLDYVGHADVTRRLIETDPMWTWDPAATDENGLPLLDTDRDGSPVGMWIKLTVLGVTRLGYGSCPSGQGDAVKVLIGDALRNAAMRFGVALDLWAKGDRADPAAENATAASGRRAAPQRQQTPEQGPRVNIQVDAAWVKVFEKRLSEASIDQIGPLRQEILDGFKAQKLDSDTGNRLMDALKQRQGELTPSAAA